MKSIILNWMPPAKIDSPSPSLSVLKNFLQSNGFKVKVNYWNLLFADLQMNFWGTSNLYNCTEEDLCMLFASYLSIQYKDKKTCNRIKARLIEAKPEGLNLGANFYEDHMALYARRVSDFIDKHLDENDYSDVLFWGFTLSLQQWLPASLLATKIKEKYPNAIIIAGGISSKGQAEAYLKNFEQFDFAIYGEGENSLLSLSNELLSGRDFNNIPGLVYRSKEEIIFAEGNREYVDLSESNMDFSDFFNIQKCLNIMSNSMLAIPLETSRGCHWNKCHFCYLNKGYRYRVRPISTLIDNIIDNISKYDVYKFMFLDCDLVGKDLKFYNILLDELIILKEKFPKIQIVLAEIITKGLEERTIKKMSLAGFDYVQIGYESSSNELLKKIEKKNTFASNLLFIKFATKYKISISGANVLCNLLEEEEEDILEAILNLFFMRFFLRQNVFSHSMSVLAITNRSRYYKLIENDISKYEAVSLKRYISSKHMKYGDPNNEIFDLINPIKNPLWEKFSNVERNLINNNYSYTLLGKSEGLVIYREYYNQVLSNEIEFDLISIEWFILSNSNSRIMSYNELYNSYKCQNNNTLDFEFISCIEELKSEGLLYVSNDYNEIVAIIDTNIIC